MGKYIFPFIDKIDFFEQKRDQERSSIFFLVLNALFRDDLSAQLEPVKWRQSIQDTADVSGCLVRLFIEVLLQALQPWLPTLFPGYCFFPSPEARMKEERPWELGCAGCLNFLLVFIFHLFSRCRLTMMTMRLCTRLQMTLMSSKVCVYKPPTSRDPLIRGGACAVFIVTFS